MSSSSYSTRNNIEKEIEYLGRRLDKYAKFYWRGEDMWETYHTFITNNGSALKFVNGPSFSNEYSSPQYDHAMGNLTGVKFTRMQVSFSICTYGVTAAQYRSLIAALGPYEIDYLAFDYDDKLCYLAKTTGMKEAVKTIIGVDSDNNDLYMVENNITFEVQGEQCALAQRQYVWTVPKNTTPYTITPIDNVTINMVKTEAVIDNWMLSKSEKPFSVVGEIRVTPISDEHECQLDLYITNKDKDVHQLTNDDMALLCHIEFNKITTNWQNTEVNSNATAQPQSFQDIDKSFSIKYDSVSGLIFMQYGESDYKVLNLLLTNTYGEYLIKNMSTTKMKIDKNEDIKKVYFVWKLTNFDFIMEPTIIKIRQPQGDGSAYVQKVIINGVEYLFKENGNYIDLPQFTSTGTLNERSNDVQLQNNGQFSFKVSSADSVSIVVYQQNHVEYSINNASFELFADPAPANWTPFVFTFPKTIDPSTVQTYGRAKAILV